MRIDFNPDVERVLSAKGKKILFVHVGKCAGESIIQALQRHLPDDFLLFEMHVYDANVRIREVVSAAPPDLTYVIASRDPVDRYVSAFNWDKHNLFLSGALDGNRHENSFKLFPTVDTLISGLGNPNAELRLAATEFSRFGHMAMGQHWYTPLDVLKKIPQNRTYVIDIATMKKDLLRLLDSLGYPQDAESFSTPRAKSGVYESYENYNELFSTFLSQRNRQRLLQHIAQDLNVYNRLKLFGLPPLRRTLLRLRLALR